MNLAGPLRLMCLGAGAVVREFYLPALEQAPFVERVLVIDSSEAALDACASLRSQKADFLNQSFREALQQGADRVGAVLVALPNWLHAEAVSLAVSQGLPVLCEKPLALTREDCMRLEDEASAAGVPLLVSMTRRYLPSVRAIHEALEAGLAGDVVSVELNHGGPYAWPSDSGAFFQPASGGVLADMGVHYLDMATSVLGPLRPVSYQDDWGGGVEANALMELRSEAGVPVTLRLSRTRRLPSDCAVRGSLGVLTLSTDDPTSCSWAPSHGRFTARLEPSRSFASGDWPPAFSSCFIEQLHELALAVRAPRRAASGPAASEIVGHIDWAYSNRTLDPVPADSSQPTCQGVSVVTGGTGFIGGRLVERLSEAPGADLRVPVRGYRTCAQVARFPVALPRVDLLDRGQTDRLMRGARWVFHLAYGRDGPTSDRMTVEGTKCVVEAAIAAGCEAVVVLSTMLVYGRPYGKVSEASPYAPSGTYAKQKAEMERWCLERARSSGATRIVVLQPSCVYGPLGKTFTWLPVELAARRSFCWIDDGVGLANVIHVDNLLDAMLLAANRQAAHGERFLVNDAVVPWREFLTPLLGPHGHSLPSFSADGLRELSKSLEGAPARALVRALSTSPDVVRHLKRTALGGGLLSLARRWAPGAYDFVRKSRERSTGALRPSDWPAPTEAPVPPVWLPELFGDFRTEVSTDQIQRVLGWAPRRDLPQGLAETQEWLREQGAYDP